MNNFFIGTARYLKFIGVSLTIVLAAMSAAEAAPILSIDLNSARPLQLKTPAKDVIVANPSVADVALQSPDHLVIIGKQPGRTSLIIMDANQKIILNQMVIVTEGDSATVSVYGPRGGTMKQDNYACAYHCTLVPGTDSGGASAGGGMNIISGSPGNLTMTGNFTATRPLPPAPSPPPASANNSSSTAYGQ